jgi:hypothetical protein
LIIKCIDFLTNAYLRLFSLVYNQSWFTGKFGHGVGWENTDMKANQDGINYGKTVNKSCKDETGEFCK